MLRRYECRMVGTSSRDGIDAAAAYVVVVADPPRCDGNLTRRAGPDDPATIECSVTFLGQNNLTLEWLAPNGTVIGQEEFSSGEYPSVARLRVGVEVPTPGRLDGSTEGGYQCRAYFSNGTAQFPDQASNAPEFRRNTCTVPLPSPTASPVDTSMSASPTDTPTSAQPPPSASAISKPVIVLLTVAGIIAGLICLICLICVYANREKLGSALLRNIRKLKKTTNEEENPQNAESRRPSEVLRLLVNKNEDNDKSGGGETSGGSQAIDADTSQIDCEQQDSVSEPAQQHVVPESTQAVVHRPPAAEASNRPISNGRPEPETTVTSVPENPNDDTAVLPGAIYQQESVVSATDSASVNENNMYDLRGDSPSVSQPNDETEAEDDID